MLTNTLTLTSDLRTLKTQQLYKGFGSKEYNDVLQKHLNPKGNKLLQSADHWSGRWQLQQD